jgi:hypothetical protein
MRRHIVISAFNSTANMTSHTSSWVWSRINLCPFVCKKKFKKIRSPKLHTVHIRRISAQTPDLIRPDMPPRPSPFVFMCVLLLLFFFYTIFSRMCEFSVYISPLNLCNCLTLFCERSKETCLLSLPLSTYTNTKTCIHINM